VGCEGGGGYGAGKKHGQKFLSIKPLSLKKIWKSRFEFKLKITTYFKKENAR